MTKPTTSMLCVLALVIATGLTSLTANRVSAEEQVTIEKVRGNKLRLYDTKTRKVVDSIKADQLPGGQAAFRSGKWLRIELGGKKFLIKEREVKLLDVQAIFEAGACEELSAKSYAGTRGASSGCN